MQLFMKIWFTPYLFMEKIRNPHLKDSFVNLKIDMFQIIIKQFSAIYTLE